MENSSNLNLPYIAAAQAQKHVTHNAAILALDAIVQLTVLDRGKATPPLSPASGDRHIVAPGATDAWTGKDNLIAAWQDGDWVFYQPGAGWISWIVEEKRLFAWEGSSWVGISFNDVQSVSMMGVNAQPDDTNRLSIAAPTTLFNHEGEGHQLKINKNLASDTASVLFQTNWSGRAEMGTSGDDNLRIKVSADGSAWWDAVTINGGDGTVTILQELIMPDGVKIANAGETETAGVEIEGGGTYGRVAMLIKSSGNLTGALFEQRSHLGASLDVIDFGFKTLSQQVNMRTESRSQFTFTGDTPEWQVNDSSGATLSNFLAISPTQCQVSVPLVLPSFTIAGLPSASTSIVGALCYVSDALGGAVPAFCDGTNWRTVSDRTIVS